MVEEDAQQGGGTNDWQARQRLAELETVYASAPIGLAVLDRDLRYVRINDRLAAINGRPPAEHIGRLLSEMIPYLADTIEPLYRYVLLTGKPLRNVEYSGQTPSQPGVHRTFVEHYYPLKDETGQVFGINVVVEETTEQKQTITALRQREKELGILNLTLEQQVQQRTQSLLEANQQLKQSFALFSGLFHGNPMPTSLTGLEDSVFLDVNEAYCRYFELERKQLLGRPAHYFQQWLPADERAQMLAQIRQKGRVRDLELHTKDSSGRPRTALLFMELVQIEKIEAVLTVLVDITERVDAEQQLRELASQLTEAEQEERQRLSHVLHDDLQQRLYAILVQTMLLERGARQEQNRSLIGELAQITEALREAVGITRRLSVDLSPPLLRTEGLVEAIAWLAAQMKSQYALDVTVIVDDTVPSAEEVTLDQDLRALLFRIVRELLFNVVKHAGVTEAEIFLACKDDQAHIRVSDKGQGFDPAALVDGNRGHGLWSVQHRLELFGGHMEISSVPGDGTEVLLVAPAQKKEGRGHRH